MTARARLGLVTTASVALIAVLAFIGVNFAPKPVPWMPAALGAYVLAVVAALVWALHPTFATPGSVRLAPYIGSVVGLFALFAAASYYLLFAFWFAFGGKL